MYNIFKREIGDSAGKENLVDENENKAIKFIIVLVIIGVLGIFMYIYQDYSFLSRKNYISYAFSMGASLFFVAGAAFVFNSSIGFLFGIPRPAVIVDSEKEKSNYIGNDNLLQLSDWITKIILGLGLTQIHEIPFFLKKVAKFIVSKTHVSNQALIILIIIYFACLGFLFGYLWTRLYFIKMLQDSDDDVINEEDRTAHVKTLITTDITTDVTTIDDKNSK